jgi:magnesium-transporting ATPase (P-type)
MSVVCKNDFDQVYRVFTKGAPEKVANLCVTESMPANYRELLHDFTKQGLRVLAVATKKLSQFTQESIQMINREYAESNLNFLGFLITENKLKPDSY